MNENSISFFTNKIHNGECLSILKTIPDKSVKCTITDPPYGVDLNYGSTYIDSFDNWKKMIDEFLHEAIRISQGAVLISTSKLEAESYLFTKHQPIWRICWYKGASCTRSPIGFKDWETLFVYGNTKGIQIHDYFMVHANRIRKQVPGHPCPKPLDWARWLISRFSKENDIILDPFLGSGTTAIIAKELKRNFVGIEINPQFCELASSRIGNIEIVKYNENTTNTPKHEATKPIIVSNTICLICGNEMRKIGKNYYCTKANCTGKGD